MKAKTHLTTMSFRLDKSLKQAIRKAAKQSKVTSSVYIARRIAAVLAIDALEELKNEVRRT
jgi:hypothetical protein